MKRCILHAAVAACALFLVDQAPAAASILDGEYRCAARPLAPLSFDQFKQRFMDALQDGIAAYREIGAERFDAAVRNFHANTYRPKDVVCMVGRGVTVQQLLADKVFDASGGDILVIAPLSDSDFQVVRAKAISAYVQSSTSLAEYLLSAWRDRENSRGHTACFRTYGPEPPDSCFFSVMKRTDKLQSGVAAHLEFVRPPVKSEIRVYSYESAPASETAYTKNESVLGDFVTAVHVQELAMNGRYTRREHLGTWFNVFEPAYTAPVDAYSLSDFVGTVMAGMADDQNFASYVRIGSDFGGPQGPRPKALNVSHIARAKGLRARQRNALDEMIAGFICDEGKDAALPLRAMAAPLQASFSVFQFYSCPEFGVSAKPLIDVSSFHAMDVNTPRSMRTNPKTSSGRLSYRRATSKTYRARSGADQTDRAQERLSRTRRDSVSKR